MLGRRVACSLVGLWLGCGVLVGLVTLGNFRAVDRLLHDPSPRLQQDIKRLGGADNTRLLLRHHTGELNRFYFESWELGQLAIGALLVLLLVFGTREGKLSIALALAMTLLVVAQYLLITPAIISLGRHLDYVPPGEQAGLRAQFGARHGAYSALELLKLGLGLALSFRLWFNRGSNRGTPTTERPAPAALRR